MNGNAIKNKPRTGITIAVWVYMDSIEGQQEIFQTIDSKKAINKHGMYYLEVSNGQLRWFHRNEEGEVRYYNIFCFVCLFLHKLSMTFAIL